LVRAKFAEDNVLICCIYGTAQERNKRIHSPSWWFEPATVAPTQLYKPLSATKRCHILPF